VRQILPQNAASFWSKTNKNCLLYKHFINYNLILIRYSLIRRDFITLPLIVFINDRKFSDKSIYRSIFNTFIDNFWPNYRRYRSIIDYRCTALICPSLIFQLIVIFQYGSSNLIYSPNRPDLGVNFMLWPVHSWLSFLILIIQTSSNSNINRIEVTISWHERYIFRYK
jgi:hypothetical protein